MARTKTSPATEAVELTPEAAQDVAAADVVRAAENLMQDFEEVHRQVGQIEGLEFTRRVVDVAVAQIFENLRNSSKYKGLPYRDDEGHTRYVGSLEEFCQVKLGKSYNRCIELSQNLRLLGPELYEQAERLGLRNVDYKALRALPDDDQALIKQALESSTSRERVIDLLQEMAVRHHQEKAALRAGLADKDAVLAAKQQRADALAGQVDDLNARLTRRASRGPDAVQLELRQTVLAAFTAAEALLAHDLAPALQALADHRREHGGDHDDYLQGCLGQLGRILAEIREAHGLNQAQVAEWAGDLAAPAWGAALDQP